MIRVWIYGASLPTVDEHLDKSLKEPNCIFSYKNDWGAARKGIVNVDSQTHRDYLTKGFSYYLGIKGRLINLITPSYKEPNTICLMTTLETNTLPSLFFFSLLEDTIEDKQGDRFWGWKWMILP